MIVIIFDQNSTASEVCAIEQERYSRPENFDILSHHYFHAVALEKNTVKSRKKDTEMDGIRRKLHGLCGLRKRDKKEQADYFVFVMVEIH